MIQSVPTWHGHVVTIHGLSTVDGTEQVIVSFEYDAPDHVFSVGSADVVWTYSAVNEKVS